MYDFFVGPLACPACGVITATSATNMQTHLRDDADGSALVVGTHLPPLDLRPDDILRSSYQLVRRPREGEPLFLLDPWQCPACGNADNWAMVTIAGDEITSIEAVTLDRATLERANFISDQCFPLAARLAGVPVNDLAKLGQSEVEVLRARLR